MRSSKLWLKGGMRAVTTFTIGRFSLRVTARSEPGVDVPIAH